jgi:hypothetical protein
LTIPSQSIRHKPIIKLAVVAWIGFLLILGLYLVSIRSTHTRETPQEPSKLSQAKQSSLTTSPLAGLTSNMAHFDGRSVDYVSEAQVKET